MAVQNGMANVVACIFADTAATGGAKFGGAAGGEDTWAVWGMLGNAANSALGFRRHMALYGSTSEQLGWISVTCRKHALLNPNAVMKKPMTLEDHQNSRLIVDPLHMFDCCLISDGAVCVLVTSPARAKDCKKKPVSILGHGARPHHGKPARAGLVVSAASGALHRRRLQDGRRRPGRHRRGAVI